MATVSDDGLEKFLGELGLQTPIPAFGPANVMSKPLDIGRSYLANILRSLLEQDPATIYDAVQSPTDISAGDLYVPVPRITHDEEEAEDLALDLMRRVCSLHLPGPRRF